MACIGMKVRGLQGLAKKFGRKSGALRFDALPPGRVGSVRVWHADNVPVGGVQGFKIKAGFPIGKVQKALGRVPVVSGVAGQPASVHAVHKVIHAPVVGPAGQIATCLDKLPSLGGCQVCQPEIGDGLKCPCGGWVVRVGLYGCW